MELSKIWRPRFISSKHSITCKTAPSVDLAFNCSICHAVRLDSPRTVGRAGNSGGLPLAVWPSATWNRGGSNIEQEVA